MAGSSLPLSSVSHTPSFFPIIHPDWRFSVGAKIGIREYAITPALTAYIPWPQYALRRESQAPASWAELRTHNLLDTAISGALTGGLFNSWQRACFPLPSLFGSGS